MTGQKGTGLDLGQCGNIRKYLDPGRSAAKGKTHERPKRHSRGSQEGTQRHPEASEDPEAPGSAPSKLYIVIRVSASSSPSSYSSSSSSSSSSILFLIYKVSSSWDPRQAAVPLRKSDKLAFWTSKATRFSATLCFPSTLFLGAGCRLDARRACVQVRFSVALVQLCQ